MSSAAARSATRIGWFISGTHTTAPWPTRMRRVCDRAGGQEHLGRRAVRVLLEEVVLDRPHGVEAELVGETHLLEGVLVHDALDSVVRTGGGTDSSKKMPNSMEDRDASKPGEAGARSRAEMP